MRDAIVLTVDDIAIGAPVWLVSVPTDPPMTPMSPMAGNRIGAIGGIGGLGGRA